MKDFNPILKPALFNSVLDPSHEGAILNDDGTVTINGVAYDYIFENGRYYADLNGDGEFSDDEDITAYIQP